MRSSPTPTDAPDALRDRAPTAGERRLIDSVFGPSIDPDRLRFHRRRWWPLQPRRIVMAPDGGIWFHPRNPAWRADFTDASLALRAFLVHELTHVWQVQQGMSLLLRRLPFARYRYRLDPGKPFLAYGIEQQAEMVRDAFILRERGSAGLLAYAAVLPFPALFALRRLSQPRV